jgi:hypothetical protein
MNVIFMVYKVLSMYIYICVFHQFYQWYIYIYNIRMSEDIFSYPFIIIYHNMIYN